MFISITGAWNGNVNGTSGHHLTPPLTTSRQHTKSLPSPASSPALSTRAGPCSAPPSIRIDSSDLNYDTDSQVSDTHLAQSNKVYQLPPVNTWVPKGESLFNSILDARSPQIYRRTNTSSSKTASYPQAVSPPATSRVSWPQSNTAQLSPPLSRYESQTVSSNESNPAKSPKLVHKCTSFDIERSKPFPARSAMTSPRLFRKSTSLDDCDRQEKQGQESPNICRKLAESGESSAVDMDQTVLKEVENETDIHEVPKCSSDAPILSPPTNSFDTVSSALNVVCTMSDGQSGQSERATMSSPTNIGTDKQGSREQEPCGHVDMEVQTSPSLNTGARPKQNLDGADKQQPSVSKSVSRNGKQKSGAVKSTDKVKGSKATSTPIMGQAGLKPVKKPSSSKPERASSKSATSTVKSAIITSAAKLKSISKRSPVQLLSYKSASISIPDHTHKATRKSKKGKLVHQSESSPTVLVTTSTASIHTAKATFSSADKLDQSSDKKTKSVDKIDKQDKVKPGKGSTVPAERPVCLSVQGLRRSSQGTAKRLGIVAGSQRSASSSPASTPGSTDKPKRKVPARSPTESGAKSIASKSVRSDAEKKLVGKTTDITSKSMPSKVGTSKKTKDIREKWSDDKSKGRQGTRDSASSLQSEPARKMDRFRDCCHGKKK